MSSGHQVGGYLHSAPIGINSINLPMNMYSVNGPKSVGAQPDSDAQMGRGGACDLDLFRVWKEYENVAMHFNDLLIRLRTQALGGVAALAALAGVMVRGDLAPTLRWGVLACSFLLLILFWVAVWILDMRYYNRLLHGAVKALLEIEEASRENMPAPSLALSTRIEETAEQGISLIVAGKPCFGGGRLPIWWFYSSVCFGLLCGLIISIGGIVIR